MASPEVNPPGDHPPPQGLPVLARFFVAYFIILPGYAAWILGLLATFSASAAMGCPLPASSSSRRDYSQ